jgi:hypothetical protein
MFQLLGRFYSDRSTLIWNGTKATGLMEIGDLLKDVPPSHNELLSVDCHPIAGTPRGTPAPRTSTNPSFLHIQELPSRAFSSLFKAPSPTYHQQHSPLNH